MTVEVWILTLIGVAIATGLAGFFIGKRGGADQKRVDELETELKDAQAHQRETEDGINEHFEESAELFGQLAHDYRRFFEHFASSAGKLGVAEDRTDAMLAAAQARLLTDEREVDGAVPETISDDADEEPASRVAEVSLDSAEETAEAGEATQSASDSASLDKRDQVA